ncbi:MAG: PAS domain-containing protein [Polyangiaceae bacterium]|nr:PAS domain-containing protein [Polyangiaceae bacterium]
MAQVQLYEPPRLADVLRRQKETIVRDWEKRVLSDPSVPEASRLPAPALGDRVPVFLDMLASSLDRPEPSMPDGHVKVRRIGESLATRPSAQGWLVGDFAVRSALREWSHFRAALLAAVKPVALLRWDDVMRVSLAVDAAMETIARQLFASELEARRVAEADRDRSLALLENLMTNVPAGIAFVDRSLRYVRVNETLAAFSGVPARVLEGRSIRDVVPREIARVATPHILDVFDTSRSKLDVPLSGATKKSDTSPRHFVASFYPVHAIEPPVMLVGCVVIERTGPMDVPSTEDQPSEVPPADSPRPPDAPADEDDEELVWSWRPF